MSSVLRPYQVRGVEQIRMAFAAGHRRVLYTAPTGSGKTVLFVFIVTNAVARGNRVVILVHRQELVDQVATVLASAGVMHGIIAADYPERPLAPVQVASLPTLAHRLNRYAGQFDFCVVDECHHAVAPSWRRVIAAMTKARGLGVTATPARADGRGLGDVFDAMVLGPSVGELIDAGHLSRFRVHVPAKQVDLSRIKTRAGDFALDELASVMGEDRLTDDVIADYLRICAGAPAVVFTVDVAHSRAVAARFQARGVRAVHLDGTTDRDERRRILQEFGAGEIQALTNCGLVSEGVDIPSITAVILLRPTKSLGLYLQQVGRALRPAAGKERAIILDYSGNVIRHGLPDEPRAWSLQGTRAAARDRSATFVRCPSCGALNAAGVMQCSACGAPIRTIKPPAPIGPPAVHLRKQLTAMSYAAAVEWAGASVSRLKLVAVARGYKVGWVWARMAELRAKKKRGAAA